MQIEPNSVLTLYFPIVINKLGEVEVTIEARTAVFKDTATFTVLVEVSASVSPITSVKKLFHFTSISATITFMFSLMEFPKFFTRQFCSILKPNLKP